MSCCREERTNRVGLVVKKLTSAGLKHEAKAIMEISGDKWKKLPKGWTEESLKKFWSSLTGDRKHKITKCIKRMTGKVTDPGAFCGGLASRVGYR